MAVTDADIAAKQAQLDEANQEYAAADSQRAKCSQKYKQALLRYHQDHPGITAPPSTLAQRYPQYGFTMSDYAAYLNAQKQTAYIGGKQEQYDRELDLLKDQQRQERKMSQQERQQSSRADSYNSKKRNGSTTLQQKTYQEPKQDKVSESRTENRNRGTYTYTKKVENGDGSGGYTITQEINSTTGEVVSSHRENIRPAGRSSQTQSDRSQAQRQEQHAQEKKQEQQQKEQETKTRDRQAEEARWKAQEDFNQGVQERRRQESEEEKKQRKEEERKQKEEKKAADKKRRDEEKAKDKVRREKEHEARVEQRKKNQQEYDEAVSRYKSERADQKAKEKAAREEAARKRHEQYVEDLEKKSKAGSEQGEQAYKRINDYTYTEKENYKQQIADGGYKGSSAQAKKELQDSIGDLWNMSTGDARQELSGAYKDLSGSIDTFRNAKGTVYDLYNGKVVGDGLDGLANSALNIQAAAMAVTDKNGMVELQKAILTQKLADRMVLDQVSDAVMNQMRTFQDAGTAVRNALLVERAYCAAYIKQTFGNKQFMQNVTGVVAIKVGNYVEALTNEYVTKYEKKINDKIDSTFTKIDKKLDTITERVTKKLDKLEKINVLAKMNDAIDKFTSLGGLQKKLDKSPVGFLLKPIVGAVSSLGNVAVRGMLLQTGVTGVVVNIQSRILGLQSKIATAKQFIVQKIQMVKTFVNNLKEKAKAVVTEFANKIVADIKSKIQSVVAGMGGIKL